MSQNSALFGTAVPSLKVQCCLSHGSDRVTIKSAYWLSW